MEAVAHPGFGDQVPRTGRIRLELATELAHVEAQVIQPRVVGSVVGLTATLTFVSLVVWTTVIGPVGAVLAVPASLFVKAIFVDVDPERRRLTPLLSNAPDIDAPDTEEPAVEAVEAVETTGSASPRPSVGAGLSVEGGQGTLEDDHEDPESAGK